MMTYIPEIECKSEPGNAEWEVFVTVQDTQQRKEYLSVSKGMVSNHGGKEYLTVGVVQIDHDNKKVLVELPNEADSGAGRLWIPLASFRRPGGRQ